jgi:hypothetical protein
MDSAVNSNQITASSDTSSWTFLEGLKQIDATTWLIIFLIFTFAGFNIFVYLAQGTEYLAKVSESITTYTSPIMNSLASAFGDVAGGAVDVTLEGTQKIVSGSASEINKGLSSVQQAVDQMGKPATKPATPPGAPAPPGGPSPSTAASLKGQASITKADAAQTTALNNSLNASKPQQAPANYQADDSNSKIQTGGGKAGWCYIGEDRGFRTCAQVGVNDTCMSGDIFPSQEICINPNLRA